MSEDKVDYEKLKTQLKYYKKHVSDGYVINWKTTRFLIKLINTMKPQRVLDLGTGWSSYILRFGDAEVCSLDTNEKWVEKTRGFLEMHNLDNGYIGLLEDYALPTEPTYDLVLLDTQPGRERHKLFPVVKKCCKGIIVFDDWQTWRIREPAIEFFKDWEILELEERTKDSYDRFIAVAYRDLEYRRIINKVFEEWT